MAKNKCIYCGNNPVPHALNWYFESINILFTPLRFALLYNPVTQALRDLFAAFHAPLFVTRALGAIGVISYQNNRHECKVTRAQVLWEEAEKRGIIFRELKIFGKPFDTYMAIRSGRAIVFSGLPRPTGYDDSALDSMDDKLLFKKKLQKHSLPVPNGSSAATESKALEIFNTLQKPVIVKPRSGSRGRHTTTYISNTEQLIKAYGIAKELCFWAMVEEHVVGPIYRATVINFKTRGVLRGDSPQVIGDGKSTIIELVREKNSMDHHGVTDIVLDDKAEIFLAKQNRNSGSILKSKEVVFLSEKVGVSYGGSSSEELTLCHADNISLFEAAARVTGDPIVGFDFIIPDITKSYKNQRCGFIEANSLPFIDLHHHPLHGKPENVAAAVWDLVGFN